MKLQDFELSRRLRKDTGLLDFIDNVKYILNLGRYQMRIITSVPTHTGDDGEHFLYISGKVKRLYFYDPTNGVWNYLTPVISNIALTDQGAAIGQTTIFTPSASGVYRVSVYQVMTTAGSGGTLATTIGWTDDEQAQTSKPASDLDMTSDGTASSGVLFLRSAVAAIHYTVTTAGIGGSPKFALFILTEQLG